MTKAERPYSKTKSRLTGAGIALGGLVVLAINAVMASSGSFYLLLSLAGPILVVCGLGMVILAPPPAGKEELMTPTEWWAMIVLGVVGLTLGGLNFYMLRGNDILGFNVYQLLRSH